jgi:hypothetical protein
MKRILVCAGIAMLAFSASADYIARQGNDYVRLTDKPCALNLPQKDKMLAAFAVINGKSFNACWAPVAGQQIGLLYEDGDQGLLPMSDLVPAPEA